MTDRGCNKIFTIGHSGHTIERFIELLHSNGINAIADVRSMPYSQFTPQFNREQLKPVLRSANIRYVFLGEELGARRSEPNCYVDGKARYELIARTPRFREGLHRLLEGMQKYRLALMCAEKDPVTCHRTVLVCRHLRPLGVDVSHILDDGSIETQAEIEERLLKLTRVEGEDLFCDRSESIERSYDIQSDRIAYVRKADSVNSEESEIEHEYLHNRLH